MSKKEIKNPLSENGYKTFIEQYLQIHFINDRKEEKSSLESLKNLLFPSDFPDESLNDLIEFVKIVVEDLILYVKDKEKINQELDEQVYIINIKFSLFFKKIY